MNRFIITLFFITLFYCGNSQLLRDPITSSITTTVNTINSGFGPRQTRTFTQNQGPSKYHPGIDYPTNLGAGHPAYAVQSGDITVINSSGNSTAYIIVAGWRYMHMIDDWNEDFGSIETDVVWEVVSDGNYLTDDDYIIIRTLQETYVLTPDIDNFRDGYTDDLMLREAIIISHVDDLEVPIFPVWRAHPYGGSAHSHFDHGWGSYINPLDFVNYPNNNTEYSIDFNIKENNADIIAEEFNNYFSDRLLIYGNSIILESEVCNSDDKDTEDVELSYSQNETDYINIFEWHFSGDDHLDAGDRMNGESDFPYYDVHREYPSDNIFNATAEGFYPFRSEGGHLVLKKHWQTQRQIESADNINQNVFSDGAYNIKSLVRDIRGGERENIKNVILDNFLPFIKQVKVFNNITGELLYEGGWTFNNATESIDFNCSGRGIDTDVIEVSIRVVTSEPMNNVELIAFEQPRFALNRIDDSGVEWSEVFFLKHPLPEKCPLEFTTNSLDLAGNPLEGFVIKSENSVSLSSLPKRQDDGTWLPQPQTQNDTKHVIDIVTPEMNPPQNLKASNNLPDKVEIAWDEISTTSYYCVYRTEDLENIPEEISGWIQDEIFIDRDVEEYSTYYYSVKASNYSGGEYPSEMSLTVEGSITTELRADFTYDYAGRDGAYHLQFSDKSVGTNIVSWNWDLGDGTISTEQNPKTLNGFMLGDEAKVTLEITNSHGDTDSESKTFIVEGDEFPFYYELDVRQISEYEFEFSMNSNYWVDAEQVNLFFGDGSDLKTIENESNPWAWDGRPTVYEYKDPDYTTTFKPYVKLHLKNYENGEYVDVYDGILFFRDIVLNPTDRDLDLNVTVEEFNKTDITAGSDVKFIAECTNCVGEVEYEWLVNMVPNDLDGQCNTQNDEGCFYETGIEESDWYNVPDQGLYKVVLWATDENFNRGYFEYILNVSNQGGPVDLEINLPNVESQDDVPMGLPICLEVNPVNIDEYDCRDRHCCAKVGRIIWYVDGEFHSQSCGLNDHHVDLENKITFNTPGLHSVKAEIQVKTYSYESQEYRMSNLSEYSYKTRVINVVDCEEEVVINSVEELDHVVESGYITLCETPQNDITIAEGNPVLLKARKKIVMKDGFSAKEGSVFKAKIDACPETSDCHVALNHDCDIEIFGVPPTNSMKMFNSGNCNKVNGSVDVWYTMPNIYHSSSYRATICLGESRNSSRRVWEDVKPGEKKTFEFEGEWKNRTYWAYATIWSYSQYTSSDRTEFKAGGVSIFNKADDMEEDKIVTNDEMEYLSDNAINVYPNPNNGTFFIDFSNMQESVNAIEVLNTKGQIINRLDSFNDEVIELDISNQSQGIYFVRTITDNSINLNKIVKY